MQEIFYFCHILKLGVFRLRHLIAGGKSDEVMKNLNLCIIAASFFLSHSIDADDVFRFSSKIKCELSATFIVFDFGNKIAIRNNYNSSRYKLSNFETKKNKFKSQ